MFLQIPKTIFNEINNILKKRKPLHGVAALTVKKNNISPLLILTPQNMKKQTFKNN